MKTIYSSGLAVAATPFLGIPYSWKTLLLVVLGLVIFAKGYSYYKKSKKDVKKLEASFEQNEKSTEPVVREAHIEDSLAEVNKEETFKEDGK